MLGLGLGLSRESGGKIIIIIVSADRDREGGTTLLFILIPIKLSSYSALEVLLSEGRFLRTTIYLTYLGHIGKVITGLTYLRTYKTI